MTDFPKPEVPISNTDRAEIVAIFIELMRNRDAATSGEAVNLALPFLDPPSNAQDLRSQWGMQ
jgi:predicted dinucleotide-binding enzyme